MRLVIHSGFFFFFLVTVSELVWDFISWFDVSLYVRQEQRPHYHNLHQAASAALLFI